MSRCPKRVRFALQNVIYPPETSRSAVAISFSSSFSSSSSKSSLSSNALKKTDGLSPSIFIPTPRQQLPEPRKHADRHGCHHLLQMSALTYDIRDPISTATTTHKNHPLSIETLHQSAFTPSLSHITITSSYVPWPIKVYASNASYITIKDVLSSIHSVFRTNITPADFQLLPSDHHRKRATRAYQHRYRRLRNRHQPQSKSDTYKASELERRSGMKRIDFLMGHTKFLGISSKGYQHNDLWSLHVTSSPTKPRSCRPLDESPRAELTHTQS